MPSRRFGRSLGIDLIPAKTCSFDCVFCEVGRTTRLTRERRDWVPVDDVLAEFEAWSAADGRADCVTLAGSGEPTLHLFFGRVIEAVRARRRWPVVLLTNGTLMDLPTVRAAAARADIVKISLNAADATLFQRINRPAPGFDFDRYLDGLRAFRRAFHGRFWLEVFIVAGINDNPAALRDVAALARGLTPEKIHLNTVARPPADADAAGVARRRLEDWAGFFEPRAEVIGPFAGIAPPPETGCDEAALFAALERRPLRARDLTELLGLSVEGAERRLEAWRAAGRLVARGMPDGIYYSVIPPGQ